jgi:hypothetical protein
MKVLLVLLVGSNFYIEEPVRIVAAEYDRVVQCESVVEMYETKDVRAVCVIEGGQ